MGTGITAEAMRQRLAELLAPTMLEVIDESSFTQGHAGADGTGFGTHFRVRIASPLFAGLSRVARHRLVYDALQDFVDRGRARPRDRDLLTHPPTTKAECDRLHRFIVVDGPADDSVGGRLNCFGQYLLFSGYYRSLCSLLMFNPYPTTPVAVRP